MDKELTTPVMNVIRRHFRRTKHNIRFAYSNTIEITGINPDYDTRLWIRLSYGRKPNKIIVDFSNINLDKTIRGKGRFRKLVADMVRASSVERVQVSSVLTDEMHRACLSLGMTPCEAIQGYVMYNTTI